MTAIRFLRAALTCAPLSTAASASPDDVWIVTKAKIQLLTAEDVSVTAVGVDSTNGRVTLHGRVGSEAERERAEKVVRGIRGVSEVRNLLRVVADADHDLVKERDEAIEARVASCLESDRALRGVRVRSVSDGVVLLGGEADAPGDELRAIETVHACTRVRRVASEVRTRRP